MTESVSSAGGSAERHFIHATAIVIGEVGVLIRGPSGSGKSSLAMWLLSGAERRQRFARLLGDDRVSLTPHNGVVVIRPHPVLVGRIERRTQTIGRLRYVASGVARLVVDLCAAEMPRLADDADPSVLLAGGIAVPVLRVTVPAGALTSRFVFEKIDAL